MRECVLVCVQIRGAATNLAFQDGYARVRGTQINTDDLVPSSSRTACAAARIELKYASETSLAPLIWRSLTEFL